MHQLINNEKYIIANWKMNGTKAKVLEALETWEKVETKHRFIFCPPICWAHLKQSDSQIKLGAQACHHKENGAYTGYISPLMLQELNCSYVLVGHSEQRPCPTQAILKAAYKHDIKPIWCIGHRESLPSAFNVEEEIQYLGEVLRTEKPDFDDYIIAYEPLSAIGTGKPLETRYIKQIIDHLKSSFRIKQPILYGGSVNLENAKEVLDITDGILLGSASLDIELMCEILRI